MEATRTTLWERCPVPFSCTSTTGFSGLAAPGLSTRLHSHRTFTLEAEVALQDMFEGFIGLRYPAPSFTRLIKRRYYIGADKASLHTHGGVPPLAVVGTVEHTHVASRIQTLVHLYGLPSVLLIVSAVTLELCMPVLTVRACIPPLVYRYYETQVLTVAVYRCHTIGYCALCHCLHDSPHYCTCESTAFFLSVPWGMVRGLLHVYVIS